MIKRVRVWFYYYRRDIKRYFLFKRILRFGKTPLGLRDYKQEIYYIKENGLVIFPYPFEKNYKNINVKVDLDHGFPTVDYFGKRMFFQKRHSVEHVKYYFKSILQEQDLNSPHRYCTDSFKVEKDDILIDLGVAEGNFSLIHAEIAKKIFLIESNPWWVEALTNSFYPFVDKLVIINKEVSDLSSDSKIALDDIGELKNNNLFIKIDVDGCEFLAIRGMKILLEETENIKVAICTYHKPNDAVEFETFFRELGFTTEFSPGYMLFFHDKDLNKPYFRKGVLRAWKKK